MEIEFEGVDHVRSLETITDKDGLRWVFRQTRSVRTFEEEVREVPAVEVICLDDFALSRVIPLNSTTTVVALVETKGEEGKASVVSFVKNAL